MTERRQSQRRRMLKAARVHFHRDWPDMDCTVRNQSLGGACLEMPDELTITLGFTVAIARERTLSCRQVWRQGRRIGVAFV